MRLASLSILTGTLLFSNSSEAQIPVVPKVLPEVTVGIKAGANFQKLTGSGWWANKYNPGFTGGAFVGITKKKIGIHVEALISSAKFDYTPQYVAPPPNPPASANTVNLNVPVVLEYELFPHFWAQIGPQFSDLLSAKDNNSDVVKNTIKTNDFACLMGLQAILPLHFTVSIRYILGLTNVSNLPSDFGTWNNRSIQLTMGYRFLL